MTRRSILVLSLLVAFGLRAWNLGAQSIWIDEGLSIWDAQKNALELLATHAQWDIHPPLYYLILHFWMSISGSSEFAVRFLSVSCDVLAVALVYWLAKLLQRKRTSDTSGVDRLLTTLPPLLMAVSPFLVFTSQEARMYSMLTMLGVLATAALWRAIEAVPSRSFSYLTRWGFYALAVALMAYTHYFAAFVVAFHGLFLLIAIGHYRRRVLYWPAALCVTAILYAPWGPSAWLQVTRLITIPDVWPGVLSVNDIVARIAISLVSGSGADTARALPALAATAFVVVGMALAIRDTDGPVQGWAALLVTLYLVVPVVMFLAALYVMPKFVERYAIVAVPGLMLVLGVGLQGWSRFVSRWHHVLAHVMIGIVAILVLGISTMETTQVYSAASYARDDTRGVANYISERAEPDDTIILMMDTSVSFRYYYKADTALFGIDPVRNIEYLASRLESAIQGKRRLWLVQWKADWADPARFVRGYLDNNFNKIAIDQQFHGYELQLYELDPSENYDVATSPEVRQPGSFEDQIELMGHDPIPETVSAGESAPLSLFWKVPHRVDDDLLVSLRLRRGDIIYWSKERRPTAYSYPTSYWSPNELVLGRLPVEVPPGTPPGQYEIDLAIYSVREKRDLDLLNQDKVPSGRQVTLGTIEVVRPTKPTDPGKLALDQAAGRRLTDSLILAGSELGGTRFQPGQRLPLTLRWLATAAVDADYRVLVSAVDGQGQAHALYDGDPVQGEYPTHMWQAGEVVVDKYILLLPAGMAPGDGHLYLSLLPPSNAAGTSSTGGNPIPLGNIQIAGRERPAQPPSQPQYIVGATIGQFARLVGYDLSGETAAAGSTLKVTLQWQGLRPGDGDYKVFVHLLDSQERVRAQQDNQPDQGRAPTQGWLAGDYITDAYQLQLPAGLTPGKYELEVGMYDPQTGDRQAVTTASGEPAGNRLLLKSITVTER